MLVAYKWEHLGEHENWNSPLRQWLWAMLIHSTFVESRSTDFLWPTEKCFWKTHFPKKKSKQTNKTPTSIGEKKKKKANQDVSLRVIEAESLSPLPWEPHSLQLIRVTLPSHLEPSLGVWRKRCQLRVAAWEANPFGGWTFLKPATYVSHFYGI